MTESKLQAAAKKIRETAEGCPPWPWVLNAEGDEVVAADGIPVTEVFALSSNQQRKTARHIRLWHPGVSEWVADLLEKIDQLEHPNRIDVINAGVTALGLARRILGEEEPSVDEQVELASEAVGEAAASLGDRFVGVEGFDAGAWPGTGPASVKVTYRPGEPIRICDYCNKPWVGCRSICTERDLTLAERLANAIPYELTATPHVGVGGARRSRIADALLPVVQAELAAVAPNLVEYGQQVTDIAAQHVRQVKAVREFAEGMKTWGSPHGVALEYALRLLEVLDRDSVRLDAEGLGVSVDEVKRQLRAVRLHGHGFLLDHGGEQVALDPAKVMMVLPADLPQTEMELRSRIAELEAQRDKTAAGIEAVVIDADRKGKRVAQLLGRIAQIRRIADEIECTNCDHPAKLHIDGDCTAPRQDPVFPQCRCSWGRGNIAEAIDEALGGERADG